MPNGVVAAAETDAVRGPAVHSMREKMRKKRAFGTPVQVFWVVPGESLPVGRSGLGRQGTRIRRVRDGIVCLKQEPKCYSFADLQRDGRTVWDGVGNALARKHLRQVKLGDRVLFYHTGAEKAVVGVMCAAADGRRADGRRRRGSGGGGGAGAAAGPAGVVGGNREGQRLRDGTWCVCRGCR